MLKREVEKYLSQFDLKIINKSLGDNLVVSSIGTYNSYPQELWMTVACSYNGNDSIVFDLPLSVNIPRIEGIIKQLNNRFLNHV